MLRVIGAGFSRTGTHSLALALDELGFGFCYTLLDVDKIDGHVDLWHDSLEGRALDWSTLFQNYRSAVEWPIISFLPQLVNHFPKAKVILTVRDPGSWYESAAATIFPTLEATEKHPDPQIRERSNLNRRLILEQVFSGRYWDKTYAIKVYRDHVKGVEELVPGNRLLHYQVTEGWSPLCAFLGETEPHKPFPRQNERASFLASAPEWAIKVMKENRADRYRQRKDEEKKLSDT